MEEIWKTVWNCLNEGKAKRQHGLPFLGISPSPCRRGVGEGISPHPYQLNTTCAQRASPAVTEPKSSPPAIGMPGNCSASARLINGDLALPPVR